MPIVQTPSHETRTIRVRFKSAIGNGAVENRDNPWPGLATFTEEQAGLFHGRGAEIRDLTKRAERNPLTVLFGQSGLGKSSLLQAGVFPRLRASDYWPIYVRLDHGPGAPPPTEQIKALVLADTARAGTWTKPGSAQPGGDLTVWPAPPAADGKPVPEWLLRLATAMAGGELDRRGNFRERPLRTKVFDEIRRELAALPDDAPYVEWGRWFLADRATRPVGPGLKITAAEAEKLAAGASTAP